MSERASERSGISAISRGIEELNLDDPIMVSPTGSIVVASDNGDVVSGNETIGNHGPGNASLSNKRNQDTDTGLQEDPEEEGEYEADIGARLAYMRDSMAESTMMLKEARTNWHKVMKLHGYQDARVFGAKKEYDRWKEIHTNLTQEIIRLENDAAELDIPTWQHQRSKQNASIRLGVPIERKVENEDMDEDLFHRISRGGKHPTQSPALRSHMSIRSWEDPLARGPNMHPHNRMPYAYVPPIRRSINGNMSLVEDNGNVVEDVYENHDMNASQRRVFGTTGPATSMPRENAKKHIQQESGPERNLPNSVVADSKIHGAGSISGQSQQTSIPLDIGDLGDRNAGRVTPIEDRFRTDQHRTFTDHPAIANGESAEDWSDICWAKYQHQLHTFPRFDITELPLDPFQYRTLEKRITSSLRKMRGYVRLSSNGQLKMIPLIQLGGFRRERMIDLLPRMAMVYLMANRRFGPDSSGITDIRMISESFEEEAKNLEFYGLPVLVCATKGHWLMPQERALADGRCIPVHMFRSMINDIREYGDWKDDRHAMRRSEQETFERQLREGHTPPIRPGATPEEVAHHKQRIEDYRREEYRRDVLRRDEMMMDLIRGLKETLSAAVSTPREIVVTAPPNDSWSKEDSRMKKYPRYPSAKLGESGTIGQAFFSWIREYDYTCADRNVHTDQDKLAWLRECIDHNHKAVLTAVSATRQFNTWGEAKMYLIRTLIPQEQREPLAMWERVRKLKYDHSKSTVEAFSTEFLTTVQDYQLASTVNEGTTRFEPSKEDQAKVWFAAFANDAVTVLQWRYTEHDGDGMPDLKHIISQTKKPIEEIFTARRLGERETKKDHKLSLKRDDIKGGFQNDHQRRDNLKKENLGSRPLIDRPPIPPWPKPQQSNTTSNGTKPTHDASGRQNRFIKKFDEGDRFANVECYRCGETGHISPQCTAPAENVKDDWKGYLLWVEGDDGEVEDYDPQQAAIYQKAVKIYKFSLDASDEMAQNENTDETDF